MDDSRTTETGAAPVASGPDHALLAAVLRTSVAAITVLDPDGRIVYANPGAVNILGLEPDEIVQRRYDAPEWHSTDVDGGPWPDEKQPFRRVMDTGEPVFDVRHAIEWPGGERKLISVNGAPILDAEGNISRLVFQVTDITEREHAARELQRSQRLESVGRLAGGLAHDFGNLLTVITGSLDLLERRAGVKEENRSLLASMREATERGSELTRRLLSFASAQPSSPTELDVATRLRETEDFLDHAVGEHVRLEVDLEGGAGAVRMDPVQLDQIVTNLALNARDAMPGGGCLTISCRGLRIDESARDARGFPPSLAGDDWIELAVSDTGVGIEASDQSLVFDPYYSTKHDGFGLGLSSVYGIVRAVGGHVTIQSRVGEGTTFRVFLPRATSPGPA